MNSQECLSVGYCMKVRNVPVEAGVVILLCCYLLKYVLRMTILKWLQILSRRLQV